MAKTMVRSATHFPQLNPEVEVHVTRNDITLLMLESHKKAENSSEEIMALREIAKLNDLYPSSTTKVDISIAHVERSLKELEGLSTEKLLQLAGEDADILEMPDTIEGEYREVEEVIGVGTQGKTQVMPIEDV
jgi:hypothetical protein